VLDGSHIFKEPPVPALLVTVENHPDSLTYLFQISENRPKGSDFQSPLFKRFSNGLFSHILYPCILFGGSLAPGILIHLYHIVKDVWKFLIIFFSVF
jgi:hypothetical protein